MRNPDKDDRSKVILVDEHDRTLGIMDKMQAHTEGRLHRAFSVFIFNHQKQLLLQQRAFHKYHGAGLWSNTCCSHPQWNEDVRLSAIRRLQEEMGLQAGVEFVFSFIYKAAVENDLTEYEYDHVFIGFSDAEPMINQNEVAACRWMDISEVVAEMEIKPMQFTVWFKQALPELLLNYAI